MAPNANQIHRLTQDVGHTCGMDITCTKDCQVLSDQLRTFDNRYPVSVSTLRRFFGLVENQGKFSKTTLNTLARFCGHMSFEGWAQGEKASAPPVRSTPTSRATAHDHAQAKSDEAMKDEMRRFLKDHADPDRFRLNAKQFNAFKDSWFELYRRGTFNIELWGGIQEAATHPSVCGGAIHASGLHEFVWALHDGRVFGHCRNQRAKTVWAGRHRVRHGGQGKTVGTNRSLPLDNR